LSASLFHKTGEQVNGVKGVFKKGKKRKHINDRKMSVLLPFVRLFIPTKQGDKSMGYREYSEREKSAVKNSLMLLVNIFFYSSDEGHHLKILFRKRGRNL